MILVSIRGRAVLAQLGLALEPGHRDLEADHALDHGGDEVRGLAGQRPRPFHSRFLDRQQAFQVRPRRRRVGDDSGHPVSVDDHVVPRRHHLFAGRVPGRRDVGVRPLEHDHGLAAAGERLPMRVGPRHVAAERAIAPAPGVEQERQVGRERRPINHACQGGEVVGAHQRMQRRNIVLGEMAGNVHGGPLVRRLRRTTAVSPSACHRIA